MVVFGVFFTGIIFIFGDFVVFFAGVIFMFGELVGFGVFASAVVVAARHRAGIRSANGPVVFVFARGFGHPGPCAAAPDVARCLPLSSKTPRLGKTR